MTSRAQELFGQIAQNPDPYRLLSEYVQNQKRENEFLEFKGASRIQDSQAKEYWSKALSGFANTEGGVLVWGIRAARVPAIRGERGIDAASEIDLVPSCPAFSQLLSDTLLEAVVEPIPGVEILEIKAAADSSDGFVVALIPEGTHKPYRAELTKEHQYYQRIGDSFAVLPHALLRSLFYPQLYTRLSAAVSMQAGKYQGRDESHVFYVSLENDGPATARDVCFHTNVYGGEFDIRAASSDGWKLDWCSTNGSTHFALTSSVPIHPEQNKRVFEAYLPYTRVPKESIGDVKFFMTAWSRDQLPSHMNVEFGSAELRQPPVHKHSDDGEDDT